MKLAYSLSSLILAMGCNSPEALVQASEKQQKSDQGQAYTYLALGDSYTIGESVCDQCSFPTQLSKLIEKSPGNYRMNTRIIARTGWTTADLLQALEQEKPEKDYALVSLLIGVNNQYQGKDPSIYETELVLLLRKAIEHAGGDPGRVLLVSIPDYAYTPFGQGRAEPEKISAALDSYNNYAAGLARQYNLSYVYITDISRKGLAQPALVATDSLHPSEDAYALIAARLLPLALEKLKR